MSRDIVFRIRPRAGLLVRDPFTYQPLAADGEDKPRNSYWRRRLKDGDVELVPPTGEAATNTATPDSPVPARSTRRSRQADESAAAATN